MRQPTVIYAYEAEDNALPVARVLAIALSLVLGRFVAPGSREVKLLQGMLERAGYEIRKREEKGA